MDNSKVSGFYLTIEMMSKFWQNVYGSFHYLFDMIFLK